jgi:LCP family protein required for cell wall assembly
MAETSPRWLLIRRVFFWAIVFAVAILLYRFVREFTVCWQLTSLPGVPPASCAGEPVGLIATPIIGIRENTATPSPVPDLPVPEEEAPAGWDGASRINILFVGLRGGEPAEAGCPFCTDTLIVLTLDPATKTAGMLSIPRDMWVNIPGFGYSRINTAWTLGRGSKLPGGGPALVMKTVSHFVGVPVDYYVQVDFDTFVDVVDLIGGVDIHNDETIVLDPMAHGRDLPKVKITCCGMRHLNGAVALAYARCRHAEQGCKDGDIGRARRQQKFIFAVRDKVFDPGNFPVLLAQAPELYKRFASGIHTNLTLDDATRLAVMVRDIPQENIKNGVIDHSMVTFDSVILGGMNASIMRPVPDRIRILRDNIFSSSGPIGPRAQGSLQILKRVESARVRVLNATSTPQLETRTQHYLRTKVIRVTEVGQAKASSRTTITLYSPRLYTFRFLIDLLGITTSPQILIKPDASQTVDIEIRLGTDWIKKLPVEEERQLPPGRE